MASQPGNSNYFAAQTISESTTAERAAPTVTLNGVPASAPYQSIFSVMASSDSGIAATITASGACSISGANITMTTGVGKCTATAKWAATQDYLATSASQIAIADKLLPVLTWATPAPLTYGTPLSGIQLDATANVAGSFAYTPAAGTILTAGNRSLVAEFTPTLSQYYYSTSAKVTLVVNKTATTTTIISNLPNPSEIGQAVVVQFTVVPASGYGTPSGHVTVSAGTDVSCSGMLTAGAGSCSLTFTKTGSKNLTGAYSGDTNDSVSVSIPATQVVN